MKPYRTPDRREGEPPPGHGCEWFETATGEWWYVDPAVHKAALHAFFKTQGAVDLADIDDLIEQEARKSKWNESMLSGVEQQRKLLVRCMVEGDMRAVRKTAQMLGRAMRAEERHATSVTSGRKRMGRNERWSENIDCVIRDNPTLSNVKLSVLADCSEGTIRNRKRLLGLD